MTAVMVIKEDEVMQYYRTWSNIRRKPTGTLGDSG